MNRFEAQNSLHTSFCAHDFSKRNLSYIQIIFKYITYKLHFIYYIKSWSKLLWKTIKIFKTFLKRLIFGLLRSTGSVSGQNGRPTGRPDFWPLGACMCARFPVDRTPFRSTNFRPTESHQLSVCFDRPGGRPWACNGQIFWKPGDRPVDRGWISALTAIFFNTFLNVGFLSKWV